MLTVWGRSSSSNVQALMWCLAELDLPVQRHNIGGRFGGTNSTQFTALNPNQTIPVLQDGTGPPIWETGAILRYLCCKYAKPPFGQPRSSTNRKLINGPNGQRSTLHYPSQDRCFGESSTPQQPTTTGPPFVPPSPRLSTNLQSPKHNWDATSFWQATAFVSPMFNSVISYTATMISKSPEKRYQIWHANTGVLPKGWPIGTM